MEIPYTYVFVRTDIPSEAQIVQAGHACLEAGFDFPRPNGTCHMVLIGVPSEEKLVNTARYLEDHEIAHRMFHEPDYGMGFSAIATEPIHGDRRKPLRKFQLLKH